MSKLLEELKQNKPFENFEEEVFLNVSRTAEVLSWKFAEIFKEVELTPVQYNVLRILRGSQENGLTCSEISERLVKKDSDITRLLNRLETAELIERRRDDQDRRVIFSQITAKGLKVLTELDAPILNYIKEQFSHFSREQLEQLNDLLVMARSRET